VTGEQRDVARPIAQRRGAELEHGEAVVEILSKSALFDPGAKVLVGGRDDSHVHGFFDLAADRANATVLENAQKLGLHARRHVADLVQKKGPAVGEPEKSGTIPGDSGIRPTNGAEELALEQRFGYRGAVEGHEGSVPPWARAVERARDALLA